MSYYYGINNNDNHPKVLNAKAFADFITNHLNRPVVCHVKGDAYARMNKEEQHIVKNCKYFTSATFGNNGKRLLANVTSLNLLVLDVDDSTAARRVLAADLSTLVPWNYCLWNTLTSTAEAPRLRLVVDSEPLSVAQYQRGVKWLASLFGITANTESLDAAHLWYWPSVFSDHPNAIPILSSRINGEAIKPQQWGDGEDAPSTVAKGGGLPAGRAEDIGVEQAKEMLSFIDPEAGYHPWVKVGMALKHQFGEEGLALWDEWSRDGESYPGEDEVKAKYDSFKRNESDPITLRSVIKRAKAGGWSAKTPRLKIEEMILKSSSVDTLLGPVLKAIHNSKLPETEVELLLSKIKDHARDKYEAKIRISTLRSALAGLETKNTTIPVELQGFVFVSELNQWVHPSKGVHLAPAAFDIAFSHCFSPKFRPTTEARNTLKLPTVHREGYDPTRPSDLVYGDEAGVTYVNTYKQSYPEPDPKNSPQAKKILEEHLKFLFPSLPAREQLLSWVTWCLTNPGQKCNWHVFIQGIQGCGKSLVAEAFAACFGSTNARKVGNHMLTEKYNAWLDKVLFLYFEEVLLGDRQKDLMEAIKDLVTGQTANIRAMRTDSVERPNLVTGGIFLSNHLHGLRIEPHDRRFFCLCCAPQSQKDLPAADYFVRLARLKGNLAGGLRHYLLNRPISPDFNAFSHAPHTPDRDLVLRAGCSEVEHAVMSAIESGDYDLITREALSIGVLMAAVRSDLRHVSAKSLARALAEAGWKPEGQKMLSNSERHSIWYHPERLNGFTPVQKLNAALVLKEII